MISSKHFARLLRQADIPIWRERLLALYDMPFVRESADYAIAYRLRSLVIKSLEGRDSQALALGEEKAEHQLQTIQDLLIGSLPSLLSHSADPVAETYNSGSTNHVPLQYSKTLAALSSAVPLKSGKHSWIFNFMSCPSYGCSSKKGSRPNRRFDTLQVSLSHLVLSRRSQIQRQLLPSRYNYDIGQVYNFNKPFALVATRLPDTSSKDAERQKKKRMSTSIDPHAPAFATRYYVDVHSVLHIRNFWQRHLNDDSNDPGSKTYSEMAENIAIKGLTPQQWNQPLYMRSEFSLNWLGHYICVHPWPKTRQELDERQTGAEAWDNLRPMNLQLETSPTNTDEIFWPPAFQEIPIFSQNMPNEFDAEALNLTYFRGIAPFKNIKPAQVKSNVKKRTNKSGPSSSKWHPFTSSRVHGFVHDISDESMSSKKNEKGRFKKYQTEDRVVPGWKRIMMIIYKPSTHQLVSTLEHAQEEYGGPMDIDLASIWNNVPSDQTSSSGSSDTSSSDSSDTEMAESMGSTTPSTSSTEDSSSTESEEEQVEARLKEILTARIADYSKTYATKYEQSQVYIEPEPCRFRLPPKPKPKPAALPPLFSPAHIREIEEAHSSIKYMTWDDGTIDYAYAYEGIVIPGGKIMMGRWWRVHGKSNAFKTKNLRIVENRRMKLTSEQEKLEWEMQEK